MPITTEEETDLRINPKYIIDVINGITDDPRIIAMVESLTGDERQVLLDLMTDIVEHGDESFAWRELWTMDYVNTPPSIVEFLTDDYFLGGVTKHGDKIYPVWRDALEEVHAPGSGVTELILKGPIGTGKTSIAVISMLFKMCHLGHMRMPHDFYNLMAGAIFFGCVSITLDQVEEGGYADMVAYMQSSPYFREKMRISDDKRYKGRLVEMPNHIKLIAGSLDTHTIGRNLLGCLMDEVNFRKTKDRVKESYDIYRSVKRRIESRFMTSEGGIPVIPGMVCLVSSDRDRTDFLDIHVREVEGQSNVRVYSVPIWEAKKNVIKYCGRKFRVDVGDETRTPKVLNENEEVKPGAHVIEIPVEYENDFRLDCVNACREIAGVAVGSELKLFPQPELFFQCINAQLKNPVLLDEIPLNIKNDTPLCEYLDFNGYFMHSGSMYKPRNEPHALRYAHVDLAKTRDAAGIGMVHIKNLVGMPQTIRGEQKSVVKPIVSTDMIFRIVAAGSEIDFSKIVEFFIWLRERGVMFGLITYDDYQSTHSKQDLKKLGFPTDDLSLDINMGPYLNWKSICVENRFECFPHKWLEIEAVNLRRITVRGRDKIDHPARMSNGAIGCFTGDTKISLLDGREVSFEDLVKEFGDDKTFWVYSLDEHKNMIPGKAYKPRITRYVTELIELTLDTGEVIKCTRDHMIVVHDGNTFKYVQAQELSVDDSICALYRRASVGGGRRKDMNGYYEVRDINSGKWQYIHRLVYEFFHGKIGFGNVTHHNDFNKKNNIPENLIKMDNIEHMKLYVCMAKERIVAMKRDGRWDDYIKKVKDNYAAGVGVVLNAAYQKYIVDPKILRKHIKYGKSFYKTERGKQWLKDVKIRVTRKDITMDTIRKAICDGVGNQILHTHLGCGRQTLYRILHDGGYESLAVLYAEYPIMDRYHYRPSLTINMFIDLIRKGITTSREMQVILKCTESMVTRRIKKAGYSGVRELVKTNNHKIVNKKILTFTEPMPMYDLTVEKYHNFALTGGIFVKNSKDVCDGIGGACHNASMSYSGSMQARAMTTKQKRQEINVKNVKVEDGWIVKDYNKTGFGGTEPHFVDQTKPDK